MTKDEIIKICDQFGILEYIINDDMTVSTPKSVYIEQNSSITALPLNFDTVKEWFFCDNNSLTTLEGCPKFVGENFSCAYNKIDSLQFCPHHVGENFYCNGNLLTTLNDLPMNFYVGGNFGCFQNNITDPKEFSKLLFGHIGGDIVTDYTKLDGFLNENKNPPKKELPRLLSELRKIQL